MWELSIVETGIIIGIVTVLGSIIVAFINNLFSGSVKKEIQKKVGNPNKNLSNEHDNLSDEHDKLSNQMEKNSQYLSNQMKEDRGFLKEEIKEVFVSVQNINNTMLKEEHRREKLYENGSLSEINISKSIDYLRDINSVLSKIREENISLKSHLENVLHKNSKLLEENKRLNNSIDVLKLNIASLENKIKDLERPKNHDREMSR